MAEGAASLEAGWTEVGFGFAAGKATRAALSSAGVASPWEPVAVVAVGVDQSGGRLEAAGAAVADVLEIGEAGWIGVGRGLAAVDAVGDEFGADVFGSGLSGLDGGGSDADMAVWASRRRMVAGGDVSAAGEVGLLEAEESAGGAELVGGGERE